MYNVYSVVLALDNWTFQDTKDRFFRSIGKLRFFQITVNAAVPLIVLIPITIAGNIGITNGSIMICKRVRRRSFSLSALCNLERDREICSRN